MSKKWKISKIDKNTALKEARNLGLKEILI